MSEPAHEDMHSPVLPGRGRERLRALPAHRRAAVAAEDARGARPPRRAAVPDRPPVLGAVAEAGVERGRGGGGGARAGTTPTARSGCCAAPCSASSTSPRSSTCSTRWTRGSTSRSASCSGTAAASTRPASAASPHATQQLWTAFDARARAGRARPRDALPARPRARGALPGRRAADRLGRADLGVALSPLRDRRAGARRADGRHAGHARAGARQADRPAPAAALWETRSRLVELFDAERERPPG